MLRLRLPVNTSCPSSERCTPSSLKRSTRSQLILVCRITLPALLKKSFLAVLFMLFCLASTPSETQPPYNDVLVEFQIKNTFGKQFIHVRNCSVKAGDGQGKFKLNNIQRTEVVTPQYSPWARASITDPAYLST